MRTPSLVVLVLALAGCGGGDGPRLDTTDSASLRASIERLAAGMDESERAELERDMMAAVAPRRAAATSKPALGEPGAAEPDPVSTFRPLHGMSLREIRERAEAMRGRDREKAHLEVGIPPGGAGQAGGGQAPGGR